jgi:tRNA-uridine 2-sulfurtransferase
MGHPLNQVQGCLILSGADTMETYGRGKKVLVAMSGGVDSSVAALLLLRDGYHPVGVTMRLWVDPLSETLAEDQQQGCCSLEAVADARRVADQLGIAHYTLNLKDLFYSAVVQNFTENYLQGKTPNPCVECNRYLKFSALLEKAEALGLDYVATGHYVNNRFDAITGRYRLSRGRDQQKDQSYMLYMLGQRELSKTLFPLGDLTKEQVRDLAAAEKLPVAAKAESQEICFIPDHDYHRFLERECPEAVQPGEIYSVEGELLGQHRGIAFYTVGQRKGLGLTSQYPLYVVRINAAQNRVIVGREEELNSDGLIVSTLSFVSGEIPQQPQELVVKIRYRTPAVPAMLYPPEAETARVIFKTPQKAVAPGQSAVFYSENEVVGGGIIENAC